MSHIRYVASNAMTTQELHAFGNAFIVGQCHAALTGGNDLHWMKAEHRDVAVAAIANRVASVAPTNGVRRIFNDFKAVLLAECMNAAMSQGCPHRCTGITTLGNSLISAPVPIFPPGALR